MLHRLVTRYRLKVLAYTSNFDIPQLTRDNIRRTLAALDVDHLEYTPPMELYRRFIRHLLLHPNGRGAVDTVCYFWLDLREGDLMRLAVQKQVPLVLAGYSPGQPDPARMCYEMSPARIARDWTPHALFEAGVLHAEERARFWDPRTLAPGTPLPRFLAPLHAWPYDQGQVMREVVQLGTVKSRLHANPVFSNFTLNWLLMYNDLLTFGYNPYLPEFAQLIREGKASRRAWAVQFALVNWMLRHKLGLGRHVTRGLQWLELEEHELACHRPRPPRVCLYHSPAHQAGEVQIKASAA